MEQLLLQECRQATVVLLIFLLNLTKVTGCENQCCARQIQFFSSENKTLKNFTYREKTESNHVTCARDCAMDKDCKSFNLKHPKTCQLSNSSRAEHQEDFVQENGSVYFDEEDSTSLLQPSQLTSQLSTALLTARPSSTEFTTRPSSTEFTNRPSSTEPTTYPSPTQPTTYPSSTQPTTRSSSLESTTHHRPSKSPKPEYGTCRQLLNAGNTQSKVYSIYPGGVDSEALQVYCDMETDGGGWTVFQRRIDGSVDFNRTWAEYKSGFGDPSGEYWLGNDYLVSIPTQWDLRIDLEAWDGQTAYAKYQYSSITEENYRLNLGVASGPAGNSMYFGQIFTTRDKDNDNVYDKNCAEIYQGAWWFNHCSGGTKSNLNGAYRDASSLSSDGQGIWWETFKQESLKTCSMKLREVP